jgi:D-beta-D-heptose 7-phosphate kinase/D-beta-D-heptose 1-phosphate adenosyltransferase
MKAAPQNAAPKPDAAAIARFSEAVVCCVGDVMLDRFVYGSVSRISPEAPVPVLHIREQQSMLGGAGNALRNLHALGCAVRFFSVTGADPAGIEIEELLRGLDGCESFLARDPLRQTGIKTRYIAQSQQIMRADAESHHGIEAAALDEVVARFDREIAAATVALLSDYGKGVLAGPRAARFIQSARAHGKPVIVDPKGSDFRRYDGATVIKPNLKELAAATGLPVASPAEQETAARALLSAVAADHLLVTCGAEGMLLLSREGGARRFPALAREVFDVSGAGDTVAATLAAALGSGSGIVEAVEAANLAAGIVVGKRGTAVATAAEIAQELQRRTLTSASDKVLRAENLIETASRWRSSGLRIALANGCFDLLHPGHIALLEAARASADRLIVALNSDRSAARLKGRELPIQNENTRALVLASLGSVDAVAIFDADTPVDLIRQLRPDVLVKGRDYQADEVLGADLLPQWNGELLLVDLVPGHSASRMRARIARTEPGVTD